MTLSATNSTPTERLQLELRLPRGRTLEQTDDGPLVMGVVNLTPDSFSDGGRWNEPERALERAVSLIEDGAALVDLGAESTRPGGGVYGSGATEVPAGEEIDRLLPVLEGLRKLTDAPISVDTRKPEVARAALAAGADLINDISALAEPSLAEAVAAADCPIVLMHSRGEITTMQHGIRFTDVVAEVREELAESIRRAVGYGIERSQIIVDPGIGFGKTAMQNTEILSRIDALRTLGPVLVGASRKSFIGDLSGADVDSRLPGSLAAVAWAAAGGAAVVRVHDVAETVQFLTVWQEIAGRREHR